VERRSLLPLYINARMVNGPTANGILAHSYYFRTNSKRFEERYMRYRLNTGSMDEYTQLKSDIMKSLTPYGILANLRWTKGKHNRVRRSMVLLLCTAKIIGK
jgi:hypothetical protein